MTYPEVIQYLESFINYEKIPVYLYKESLKLERIKGFLDTIGNPQDSLRCIHIAGTKGKGSTCAFITYILREAGYRVGLYTSPHLSDFRERIRVLDYRLPKDFAGMISKAELSELIGKTKPFIENYHRNSEYGQLSFFEVYTTLAFLYFKKKKVDFAVLETGLGGRLDATNVVNPLVCAITPISYEHTEKLGNTLREIAMEKAGIIKAQSAKAGKAQSLIVISAPQEKEVAVVVQSKCKEVKAKLYEVGKDIVLKKTKGGFSVKGIFRKYPNLKIKLLGRHQLINASVAVGVTEALRFYNIDINADSIKRGLYDTAWPGRCEVISKNPWVVLDGAQNIASSEVLKKTIRENFRYRRLILVLGISNDKDIRGICNQLYDLADAVILTRADNPRAASAERLAQYFPSPRVHITNNVAQARALSRTLAGEKDLILVTGSLFVVGEFRNGKLQSQ